MGTMRNLGGLLIIGSLLLFMVTAALMSGALDVSASPRDFAHRTELSLVPSRIGGWFLLIGVVTLGLSWLSTRRRVRSKAHFRPDTPTRSNTV